MNIQEYISSGIVESYVLGLASAEERREFELLSAEHQELRHAREEFEISLERNLQSQSVQPPAFLREKILYALQDETASPAGTNGLTKGDTLAQTGVVVMKKSWTRYLAAASVILLVGSTALNLYFFTQYRSYSEKYNELLASQQQLAASNNLLQSRLNSYESSISLMRDPNMMVVKMPGNNVPNSPAPQGLATVYWHMQTKDVYLFINNLPQPSSDQQYQLWAIVDGKPVDAGVFDISGDTALIRMKNIPTAQVFAITLEKKGGSTLPEGKMFVLGKV